VTTTAVEKLMERADEYPTPPSYEAVDHRVRIEVGGRLIADTTRPVVVRQTGLPPVYYVPREDVDGRYLVESERTSHCPYKGDATYFALEVDGRRIGNAAWAYPEPLPEAEVIRDAVAFYAHLVEATVDGEPAASPEWKWIGGFVLPWTIGPFKGRDESKEALASTTTGKG
jgi:uncharacterized protein (DUF427 family)